MRQVRGRPSPSKRQILHGCFFIHFTSAYYAPGTVGGTKGTVLDEIGRVLPSRLTLWGMGQDSENLSK